MSREMKQGLGGAAIGALLTMLVVAFVLNPFSTGGGPPVREIVLEVNGPVFGDDNPTLDLRPGERVRLVVRNNDPGVLHSITIPAVDPEVHHVAWGDEVAVEFVVPDSGSFEYVCPQHAPKMKGRIVVTP